MGEPRGDEVQIILEDTPTRGGRERVKEEDVISKKNSLAQGERVRTPTSLIKIRNRMGPSIDP